MKAQPCIPTTFTGHLEHGTITPGIMKALRPASVVLYLAVCSITATFKTRARRASLTTMSELTGLSKFGIRKAADQLEEHNLIQRHKDGGVILWQLLDNAVAFEAYNIVARSDNNVVQESNIVAQKDNIVAPHLSLNTYNNTNNKIDSDSSDDLNDVFGPVDDSQRDQLVTGDSDTWQDTVDSEQLERKESPAEYIARRWYGAIRGDTAIDLPKGAKARRPWLALAERALSDVSGDVDGLANAIRHFYFEDERDENDFDRGQKNPRDVERLTGAIVRHYNRLEPLREATAVAGQHVDDADEPAMFEDEALLSEVKLWLKTRCPDPRQYNHLFAHWESLAEPNGVWPIRVRPDALEWIEHGTAAALVEEMRSEFDLPPFEFTSEETSHVA